jgi:hypothetical protein
LSPAGVVVHKVDRLIRSLADFAKLVELFEALVSVTQQFNPRPRWDGSPSMCCFHSGALGLAVNHEGGPV